MQIRRLTSVAAAAAVVGGLAALHGDAEQDHPGGQANE
jgi:hypothetical protein